MGLSSCAARTFADALFALREMASCVPSTARSTLSLVSATARSLLPSHPDSVSLALSYSVFASSLAWSTPSRAAPCSARALVRPCRARGRWHDQHNVLRGAGEAHLCLLGLVGCNVASRLSVCGKPAPGSHACPSGSCQLCLCLHMSMSAHYCQ